MSTPSNDSFDRDEALRARLRSTDPAADLRALDPGATSRLVRAAVSDAPAVPATRQGRLPMLVAAAVLVVAGGGGLWALTGPLGVDGTTVAADPSSSTGPVLTPPAAPAPAPTRAPGGAAGPTVLSVPDAVTAKCMVPNVEVLARQDLAFRGTVTVIDGSTVTLTTEKVYTGEVADQVQVQAPSAALGLLLSAVQFEVGTSYLVSASDGQVTLCGFSAEAGPELTALYDQAYPG